MGGCSWGREGAGGGDQVELLPDTLLRAHTHFPRRCASCPRADGRGPGASPEPAAAPGKLCLKRGEQSTIPRS